MIIQVLRVFYNLKKSGCMQHQRFIDEIIVLGFTHNKLPHAYLLSNIMINTTLVAFYSLKCSNSQRRATKSHKIQLAPARSTLVLVKTYILSNHPLLPYPNQSSKGHQSRGSTGLPPMWYLISWKNIEQITTTSSNHMKI